MNLISGDRIKSQAADYVTYIYLFIYIYTHVYGHVGCEFLCVPMYNMRVYYNKYLMLLYYTLFYIYFSI